MGYTEATWDRANDWSFFSQTGSADTTRSRVNTTRLYRNHHGRIFSSFTAPLTDGFDWYQFENTGAERCMRVALAIKFYALNWFKGTHLGPFFVTPRDDGGSTIAIDAIALQFTKLTAEGLGNRKYIIHPEGDSSDPVDITDRENDWLGFEWILLSEGSAEPYTNTIRCIVTDLTHHRPRYLAAWNIPDPTAGEAFDFAQFRIGAQNLNQGTINGPETWDWRIDEFRMHTYDPSTAVDPGPMAMPLSRMGHHPILAL